MVRKISESGERLFICEVCGFAYEEKSWAEMCEEYCRKHNACSLDIARHAVHRE